MEVPILNGAYASTDADYRVSYPVNLVPVPVSQGISSGYLKPAEGVFSQGSGPGIDRGGINWRDQAYRVMGTSFVRINVDGTLTTLGTIPGTTQVTFDYSFTYLAIAADGKLYLYNGTLTQVTDPDLGAVIDLLWVDGYFMTTDGTNLVVTELSDPFAVNPLKYGSSEIDPDPVKGLLKLRNEVYAVNRYTIEVFNNIGGTVFPFKRIEGAQIQRGAIGTFACAVLAEAIAFLGSGRNEAPAIWLAVNSASNKISTREIDMMLMKYTEAQLALCVLEVRVSNSHQWLYVHLPDKCIVYDAAASAVVGEPVWFELASGLNRGQYRAKNFVYAYDKWLCADPTSTSYGYLVDNVSTHYGAAIGWEFATKVLYNEGRGAIVHQLELVGLPGNVPLGADPVMWTSYSLDGETWSVERSIKAGKQGERSKRLVWFQQGAMRHYRIQKFRGTSDAHLSLSRLEAQLEPLAV